MRLREWVNARMRADRYDRELAAGVAPEEDVWLAVHASRIVSPRSRAAVAGALQQVARAARPCRFVAVSPCRQHVDMARGELGMLAERIGGSGPVSPQTVATARVLLSDGTGPLFFANARVDLAHEVRSALDVADRLEPTPRWGLN